MAGSNYAFKTVVAFTVISPRRSSTRACVCEKELKHVILMSCYYG